MADRGEIPRSTVEEWEDATPKGKKLPEKVKESFDRGMVDALARFGFKQAAEELRLKLRKRQYHDQDRAFSDKKAVDDTADNLAGMLHQLDTPTPPNAQVSTRDPLDRATAWGAPSNLSAGDTANRLSDMGQPTNIGTAI